MYQKYQTEALVLGSREYGEADKVFALYTQDFGLLRARASGVRTQGSKMRYALQNYSRVRVALVRGKRAWRVAGVQSLQNATGDKEGVRTFARISELVLRLVQGEETNQYFFAALSEAHNALMSPQNSSTVWATIEIVCVARVLYALGYLSTEALDLPAPRPDTYFVYVIQCQNETFYIGQTQNLQQRWSEHLYGYGADYTKRYKPVKIIHYEIYSSRDESFARERWLKTGFGRKWIKREWRAGRTRQAGTTLFAHTAYGGEHLSEAQMLQDKLLSSINRAIAETQL